MSGSSWSGPGGAYLSRFPPGNSLDCAGDYPYGIPKETVANLESWQSDHFGALRLELSETGCKYAFITVDGAVFDEGEIVCG